VFEADWDDDSAHARIGLGLQGDLSVDLSATGTIACDATFSFFDDRSLGTKVFFVGPVPIVVEPKFSLKAKLVGEAEVALTATASASGNLSAIADIPDSSGSVSLDSSTQFTGTATADVSGKLRASFTLEPSMGFLLYGIVAPKAAVESGLDATLEPCANPNIKVEQPAKLTFELEPADWLEELLDAVDNVDLDVEQEFELPGSPYLLYSTNAPVPTPSLCESPPTELPQGTVGQQYSTQIAIQAPNGATIQSYAVAAGSSLPPGLGLSSEGFLTGTPIQSGIYTFGVTATHSLGSVDERFELTVVDDSLRITTESLPSAELDEPYSATLAANRPADELVWTVPTGNLPDGVTLDPDGTLSGTPTEAGFFSITVRVQHAGGGSVEKPLSLSVTGGASNVTGSAVWYQPEPCTPAAAGEGLSWREGSGQMQLSVVAQLDSNGNIVVTALSGAYTYSITSFRCRDTGPEIRGSCSYSSDGPPTSAAVSEDFDGDTWLAVDFPLQECRAPVADSGLLIPVEVVRNSSGTPTALSFVGPRDYSGSNLRSSGSGYVPIAQP
jgi:hypothetical protein